MQHTRRTEVVRPQRLVTDPSEWALFIDIDGTLLDMAPTPDAVVVPQSLLYVLKSLKQRFGGAVALSTGRRVRNADRLFAPLKLSISGVHGTEVRTAPGAETIMLVPPASHELVRAVTSVASLVPAVLVEQKGAGIAVHYRNAPDAGPVLKLELTRIIGPRDHLILRPGRKVLEIIPKGYSKGTALTWLMRVPPFCGRRPVMIGDDVGDEPALLAAQRLGGLGLKVAGEHFSSAGADFESVSSVRSWLASLAGKLMIPTAKQSEMRPE